MLDAIIKKLTPVQRRMMVILKDGRPHTPEELVKCLNDDLGSPKNVWAHLCEIRKELQQNGLDVCTIGANGRTKTFYQIFKIPLSTGYPQPL